MRAVHFLLTVQDAHDTLRVALVPFDCEDECVDAALSLIVGAVLGKESNSDHANVDFLDAAVYSLEQHGLAKLGAYNLAHSAFYAVARAITDAIPDFGAERYTERYDYEMRNRTTVHLAIYATAYESANVPLPHPHPGL